MRERCRATGQRPAGVNVAPSSTARTVAPRKTCTTDTTTLASPGQRSRRTARTIAPPAAITVRQNIVKAPTPTIEVDHIDQAMLDIALKGGQQGLVQDIPGLGRFGYAIDSEGDEISQEDLEREVSKFKQFLEHVTPDEFAVEGEEDE